MAPPELGTAARRLADLARSARRTTRATEGDGSDLRAVVAVPVPRTGPTAGRRGVVVVEERLDDVARTVSLVRRRVVLGGLLGVLVAAITGTVFAVGLSTRLRRLEQGSRDVAAGRFATRFEVDAREDELGSLARSLDTMQRQLRELDSSRKRFIATASHELRTPLQSLSGFVELLRDEELDEEEREQFLEQLAVQVERLTRLTFDLLDLSRLEAGGVELRPEDTDLQELAQRVAAEFRPVVERQGRALRVRLVGSSVQQWCDPDRVAQIVRVLVDNALKHSDSDDAVEIRVARSGGAARIAVTDHGPGIAPEELPHLFEPFHGTGDGSGAGLGLAIARELAHRMRGSLTVDARPGTTTFTLELPA
jgi:signal transduction histidine kinase